MSKYIICKHSDITVCLCTVALTIESEKGSNRIDSRIHTRLITRTYTLQVKVVRVSQRHLHAGITTLTVGLPPREKSSVFRSQINKDVSSSCCDTAVTGSEALCTSCFPFAFTSTEANPPSTDHQSPPDQQHTTAHPRQQHPVPGLSTGKVHPPETRC
jgi:hypothetical protein